MMRRLLLAALVTVSACGEPTLRGVRVDPPKAVAGFSFQLPSGAAYSTDANGTDYTLVFFGYTHCPDVCPTTLADWKRAKQKVGSRASKVRFVFVSVDPERDTPAVALGYARQFDSTFVGLSGDVSTTEGIMQAYGVSASREASATPGAYLVSHSAQSFLVDPQGRIIAMYSLGMGWDVIADDLEAVL